jgi:hypothetical protein
VRKNNETPRQYIIEWVAKDKAPSGKGKKRALEDIEGEDDEDDDGQEEIEEAEGTGATTAIDPLDTICNQAIIANCKINVLDPPAEMIFGTWNHRPLDEAQALNLAKDIIDTAFSPFAPGNLLPLIISRDALVGSCLKVDPNIEGAPMLELTEAAKEAGTKLLFAGGRHRKRATEILHDKSMTRIAKLEKEISKQSESSNKLAEVTKRNLERMLKEENELKAKLGIWGVIVYDKGEKRKIYLFRIIDTVTIGISYRANDEEQGSGGSACVE